MAKIVKVCTQCWCITKENRCSECKCEGFLIKYKPSELDIIYKKRKKELDRIDKIKNPPKNKVHHKGKLIGAVTRNNNLERKHFAKDILQPLGKDGYMNEDFNKAYGEDKNAFVGSDRDKRTGGKGNQTC